MAKQQGRSARLFSLTVAYLLAARGVYSQQQVLFPQPAFHQPAFPQPGGQTSNNQPAFLQPGSQDNSQPAFPQRVFPQPGGQNSGQPPFPQHGQAGNGSTTVEITTNPNCATDNGELYVAPDGSWFMLQCNFHGWFGTLATADATSYQDFMDKCSETSTCQEINWDHLNGRSCSLMSSNKPEDTPTAIMTMLSRLIRELRLKKPRRKSFVRWSVLRQITCNTRRTVARHSR